MRVCVSVDTRKVRAGDQRPKEVRRTGCRYNTATTKTVARKPRMLLHAGADEVKWKKEGMKEGVKKKRRECNRRLLHATI